MPKDYKQTGSDVVRVIQDARNDKIIRDGKNLTLQRMFEAGFDISPRKGALKITSHMLQQALWKTISRMKPLDFQIHGTGQSDWKEKLISDAVSTVMDQGGFNDGLRSKDGLFQKSLMWGDGWMMVGSNPKGDTSIPVVFNPISNSNIYFDPYATRMRGPWGRGTRKCVVVFSYSWDMACSLYPSMKKKGSPGRIPRDMNAFKELERTYTQTAQINGDDITEIAYLYDLDNELYAVYGGPNLTELEKHKGDDYPFEIDGEKYIPVLHQMCMPSSQGTYNHGVFDMIYDYAMITAELMNMAIGHAEDSVYPVTLVNIPQAEASKFFNRLRMAYEMRQAGKKAYVAQEFGQSGSNQPVASTLTTQSLFQEWQGLYETFTREVGRLGINLDEIDRGATVTATQIMAEEEAASSFIKQIMEYNASEMQMAVKITLDMIKKFVKKNDKTPLQLTTNYQVEGVKISGDIYTLGDVSDDLRKNKYFVIVNARSGYIPSNIMEQAQVQRSLQLTPPGTPAWNRLATKFIQLNNQDIKEEELSAMGAQAGGAGGTEISDDIMPAETERATINPRVNQQTATF